MNRVLIVGSPAAGKSYFARELSQATGLTVTHLDYYAWQDRWNSNPKIRKKEWYGFVTDLSKKKRWIIDCNNMTALDAAFPNADTIIFLDYSLPRRLLRAIKRTLMYQNKLRTDMPPGWNEKLELGFLRKIFSFKNTDRVVILRILGEQEKINTMVFTSVRQTKKYLKSI